jgi:hypothetical protein
VKSLEGRLYHRGTAATVEISPQHGGANQGDR